MSYNPIWIQPSYQTHETPRAFSLEQLEVIEEMEMACAKAGCDDDGHKCFIVD